ncbi:hypothetical protein B0H14DRAFT_2598306 [Mycena olivaceomarginata]|nr:hypothetical protein B0H14DRAFT_2598306 [Mycena olivaceomarginata]
MKPETTRRETTEVRANVDSITLVLTTREMWRANNRVSGRQKSETLTTRQRKRLNDRAALLLGVRHPQVWHLNEMCGASHGKKTFLDAKGGNNRSGRPKNGIHVAVSGAKKGGLPESPRLRYNERGNLHYGKEAVWLLLAEYGCPAVAPDQGLLAIQVDGLDMWDPCKIHVHRGCLTDRRWPRRGRVGDLSRSLVIFRGSGQRWHIDGLMGLGTATQISAELILLPNLA